MSTRQGQSSLEYVIVLLSVLMLLFAAVGKDGALTKGMSKVLSGTQNAMKNGVVESAKAVDLKVNVD